MDCPYGWQQKTADVIVDGSFDCPHNQDYDSENRPTL
jgi:hypothetical protein